MMADYPAVKQLLADIEHPAKAKFVAEDIQRHTQDPRFLSLLQYAIKDQQLPSNSKLAGAIVLSKAMNQLYFKWQEKMLVEMVMGLITDMRVEYRIKQTLQVNLTSILEISSQNTFTELVLKAAEILIKSRGQASIDMDFQSTGLITQSVRTAVLILRCLLNSQAHFGILAKAIFQDFLESTLSSIKGFSVKQINTLIILADFWREVLEKARNGATKQHFQVLKQLSRSQHLTQWVFFLYQHDYLPGQQCFINPKSNSDHEHIQKLKVAAANLHKQILIGLEVSNQAINEEITNRQLSQITGIINTICVFVSFKTNCEAYQNFIVQLIGIIILLIKLFRREFQQIYDRILHIIAFPLLAITEEEQQLFGDDPSEFNSLAEDCCDKQTYGILKTEAARLIQTICDDINQAASYTIQHAIISLKVRFKLDTSFNQNSQHFLNVQQALTVLAILSYRIGKHQLQLKEIRSFLVVQDVKNKITPLELTRIFQFLAYNYQELYPHYTLGQKWVDLALSVSVDQVQNYPSLVYSALDFISNVFENCFIQEVAMKYMQQSNYSKNYEIRYKILQKLIAKYFMKFSDQGLSLALKKLLEVVIIDINNYEMRVKSHTMDITHSLHTCRKIAQRPQRISQGTKVRASIWDFVTNLQLFRRIYLDDQIVKIVTAFVKCEGLSTQVSQIVVKMINLFREEYSHSAYIVFINQVMVRIGDPMTCGLLYALLDGVAHLQSKITQNPNAVTESLALGNILLVLQHTVLFYGQKMNAQTLNLVAETSLLCIPAQDSLSDKSEPIIVARALNLLFICHMHSKDERALPKMLQFTDRVLFRGHDLSVLALCLTKEMFRQGDIVCITQMIILLVNSIWKARNHPEIKSKKNPKVQIKSTVVRIHKITNYEGSLKFMTKPIADDIIPEFQLRQALYKMSHNNNYLYLSIMNSLPSQVAQRLRQLISQVTIDGRRRKIIKIGGDKLKSVNLIPPSSTKRKYTGSQEEAEQMDEDNEADSLRKGLLKKKRKEEEKPSSNL